MSVPAEVLPGIWQLKLPLTGNSLREVNCYLLRDEDGYALVDCGWDTVDSLEALNSTSVPSTSRSTRCAPSS